MDRISQRPHRDRCAEHDLAVGPGGVCVLCRRTRVRPAEPSRGLVPLLLAAGLGSTLLGGVALARTRAPAPPPVEAAVAEAVPRVRAPIAVPPPCATTETRPREVQPTPVPAPPPARLPEAPPRNYLDEAYAAMPKGNLYDEAPSPPVSAIAHPVCACREGGCQPRYYYGNARSVPSLSSRAGVPGGSSTPVEQVQVQRVSASPPVAFGRGAVGRR